MNARESLAENHSVTRALPRVGGGLVVARGPWEYELGFHLAPKYIMGAGTGALVYR